MENRNQKSKKNKGNCFKALIACLAGLSLVLVIGSGCYLWYTSKIQSRYDKIQVIMVKQDGIGLKELSRAFLPEINVSMGVKLIKKANGFVSDDITFLNGQKIKIPSRKNLDQSNDQAILINQFVP